MRWYAVFVVVVAVTSLLVACGGGSDAQAIRETVKGFVQAFNTDPPKAYTYLAQKCKDEIRFIEFAAGLTLYEGFLGESELKVKNVKMVDREDDEIVADFDLVLISDGEEIPLSGTVNDEGPMRFVKEDGRWRFADCAGFGAVEKSVEESTEVEVEPPPTSLLLGRAAGQIAEADDDPALPGEYVNLPAIYGGPYPGTASHIRQDIDYVREGNTNPPAGGPHWGGACGNDPDAAPPFCGPAPWGIYRRPWQPETLVHNMEHGGVVLWYNTTHQNIIDELEDLIENRLNRGEWLVMVPYPDMEAEHIALTAWSRIDKFPSDEYNKQRVEEFIDAHERRFNPEAF